MARYSAEKVIVLILLNVQVFSQWEVDNFEGNSGGKVRASVQRIRWEEAECDKLFQSFQVKLFKVMLNEKCG